MATALKDFRIQMSDPSLFREQCYVDGAWIDADNRASSEVSDPASGEVIGTVPRLGAAETRRAIEAADRAVSLYRYVCRVDPGAPEFVVSLFTTRPDGQGGLAALAALRRLVDRALHRRPCGRHAGRPRVASRGHRDDAQAVPRGTPPAERRAARDPAQQPRS
jgi:hypothetical protein